ncbi:archaellin/type IV pilin N-terminal domain-containing protein [Candidatus Nitrosotenuis uzonensis]|uniref:Uncharacterized protein n=1 Tax=Candidatus Nitrosotenuis uzonensis TaxID=1407055 RepID=V6ATA8_9ARCH|nr:archaellin/type IV pilin N-terminal domain-containing protein [Candidatus Nitrosotenuis uzonensis]CDI05658.1 hypothetical protein NITUZ_30350 [Candidatus Nitrosotenuis uzonensis]
MMRRGISELISVVLVIVIVISGMGFYVIVSQQRILGDALSVKEAIVLSEHRISELIEQVNMHRVRNTVDYSVTHLFNYGTKDIMISTIFVNGTEKLAPPARWYVRDLTGTINYSSTIPQNMLVELVINFTESTNSPEQITNIIIHTESKKFIEILNKTK